MRRQKGTHPDEVENRTSFPIVPRGERGDEGRGSEGVASAEKPVGKGVTMKGGMFIQEGVGIPKRGTRVEVAQNQAGAGGGDESVDPKIKERASLRQPQSMPELEGT